MCALSRCLFFFALARVAAAALIGVDLVRARSRRHSSHTRRGARCPSSLSLLSSPRSSAHTLPPTPTPRRPSLPQGHEFIKVGAVSPGKSFEIAVNVESKRKSPGFLAFDQGDKLLGGHADALRGRKPANVIPEPFEALGEALGAPSVQRLLADPSNLVALEANARGGVDFVLPVGALNASDEAAPRFAAEEAAALYLAHVREFAEQHTGSPVRDAVLTVPMYATQADRLALLDAAALAGLTVLGLVEENTAAAVHYGIDRVTENGTHTLVLYNMGATSTQVSVFEYDAYVERVAGKNKSIGQARVLGKAFDASLGGRSWDTVILNYVADAFNADKKVASQLPAAAAGDVRNLAPAMVKIAKAVVKAKEVLSANDGFVVTLEGVLPDVDFRVPLTRKLLEDEAEKAGLWARVPALLTEALAQAGIDAARVDAVELVGGGVRVPKVAALLKEHVAKLFAATAVAATAAAPGPVVGTHMNGDESFALGATFIAANRSSAFRVRKVGMVDAFPYPIGVRIAHLTPDAPAAADAKPWTKRASLFSAYNALDSVKKTSFNSSRDLRLTLAYEATTLGPQLPAGAPRTLAFYNVSGIEKLMADPAYAAHGVPKVHISFLLDQNGVASVLKAEAWQERDELVPEPRKAAAVNATKAAANATNATTAANATAVNATAANATAANATAAAPAPDANEAAAEALDNATAGNASAAAAAPKMMVVKRTHKSTLHVTVETAGALAVQPLSAADKAAVFARLRRLKEVDDAKRDLESAKNELETYIFAQRDRLGDDSEAAALAAVTNSSQRDAMPAALSADEDWLAEAGASATLAVYRARLAALTDVFEPVWHRLAEHNERPKALEAARAAIAKWGDVVAGFNKTSPQVREGRGRGRGEGGRGGRRAGRGARARIVRSPRDTRRTPLRVARR